MPLPTFSRSGHPLGTLTFSRQYVFPVDATYERNQLVGFSLGGVEGGARTIKVADLGGVERRIRLRWTRLPKAEVEAVLAWLHHDAIGGAVNTFTFTDVFAVGQTVRYMDSTFAVTEVLYQLAPLDLSLRIEP